MVLEGHIGTAALSKLHLQYALLSVASTSEPGKHDALPSSHRGHCSVDKATFLPADYVALVDLKKRGPRGS